MKAVIEKIKKIFSRNILLRKIYHKLSSLSSNKGFINRIFFTLLKRMPSGEELEYYNYYLKKGSSRFAIIENIVHSKDFYNRWYHYIFHMMNIKDINKDFTDNIFNEINILTKSPVKIFNINNPKDFDRIEKKIIENDYYNYNNVWCEGENKDKKIHSLLLSCLCDKKSLELGCFDGIIVEHLNNKYNKDSYGNDLNINILKKVNNHLKSKIFVGDLLNININESFDLIYGLDIFEHFNPNKINNYIQRIDSLLENNSIFYGNIPFYGNDEIIGNIAPIYLKSWIKSFEENKLFTQIEIDLAGYPLHGHLIWAGSKWWVKLFESFNFKREIDIEINIHNIFDDVFNSYSESRRMLFVFSKNLNDNKRQEIINKIKNIDIKVLNG